MRITPHSYNCLRLIPNSILCVPRLASLNCCERRGCRRRVARHSATNSFLECRIRTKKRRSFRDSRISSAKSSTSRKEREKWGTRRLRPPKPCHPETAESPASRATPNEGSLHFAGGYSRVRANAWILRSANNAVLRMTMPGSAPPPTSRLSFSKDFHTPLTPV